MRFSRQEYWSWLPCSPPENLPDPEIEPASVSCVDGLVLYHYCSLQSPYQRDAPACKVTTCIASALFIDWMQFPEAFWDQLSSAETLIVSWFQSLQNKILQTHKQSKKLLTYGKSLWLYRVIWLLQFRNGYHVEVWEKTTKFSKAIILQLKIH